MNIETLENHHDGIWIWNIDSDSDYVSPKFWEQLGYKSDELKDKKINWDQYISQNRSQKQNYDVRSLIMSSNEKLFKTEIKFLDQKGRPIWFLCCRRILDREQDNSPKKILTTFMNISHLRALAYQESIDNRFATFGEVASSISHEINNPLAIINLSSDWLSKSVRLDKINNEIFLSKINIIKKNISRVSEIIQGLKLYSERFSDKDKRLFNLKKTLKLSLLLLSDRIERHRTTVNAYIATDLQYYGNKNQIAHVFFNIMSTLIDQIRSEHETLEIRAQMDKGALQLKFCVTSDSPIDMPTKETKSFGKGSVLGLSISKSIVENHGGEIIIDSASRCQSVEVTIPLNPEVFVPNDVAS